MGARFWVSGFREVLTIVACPAQSVPKLLEELEQGGGRGGGGGGIRILCLTVFRQCLVHFEP